MDAEVTGDLPDRTLRLEREPHRPLTQLQRILPRGSHRSSISILQDDAWFESLQETQGPSICEAPYTFEADLLGEPTNLAVLKEAFLKQHPKSEQRWQEIVEASSPAEEFYAALKKNRKFISKGEFAHDVATAIEAPSPFICPKYLADAVNALLA